MTEGCSCHKNAMTCAIYCACAADDGCCNPYTAKDHVDDAVDDTSEDDDQKCVMIANVICHIL